MSIVISILVCGIIFHVVNITELYTRIIKELLIYIIKELLMNGAGFFKLQTDDQELVLQLDLL